MTGFDLQVARLRVGLAQYRLAQRVGVSPQFLSAVERRRKRPPQGFLERCMAIVDDYRQRMRAAGLLHDPPTAD
jgi:DNA-binding XRE family transcriptional regulator